MHDRSSAGASAVPVADTVETAQPLMHQHALLQRLVDQQLDRELVAAEVRSHILQVHPPVGMITLFPLWKFFLWKN